MAMPSASISAASPILFSFRRSFTNQSCFEVVQTNNTRVNIIRPKSTSLFSIKAKADVKTEDIVIVGAGIAGLATAVSLQRLGIKSKVLEQAGAARTGGTSITLFKNGWNVLDALGVGNQLRKQFPEIEGLEINTEKGRELKSFNFKDDDESQEVRAVERRVLLETLANELPPDSISFSSKLANIQREKNGQTLLQLQDGRELSAKVVIACDGFRSPVAKWMGLPDAKFVGHCAFRGLTFFPDGQPFEPRVKYIYGQGLRVGYCPVSPTKVYWFICFNSSTPVPKMTDPSMLRQEAKELVGNWSSDIWNMIDRTPDDNIIRSPLVDRWLWPLVCPPGSKGKVVLVGDAWHPMTPNLGIGGCCALEDAIVLAKKLADALKFETMSVEDAFRAYQDERWGRVFPLTIRANFIGTLMQWDNPVFCSFRNDILIPRLVGGGMEHTNFECEPLLAN